MYIADTENFVSPSHSSEKTVNIQVVGARGMLGLEVCQAITNSGHTCIAPGIDITHVTQTQITCGVVINCAGIVKQRALPASEFIRVNGYGPQRLAESCDAARARLIQVSTDCVYNDYRFGIHYEEDKPTPDDVYSLSKLAGEVTRWPHLTVRTSFIGEGTRGLLHDLRQSRGKVIETSATMLWSGHTVKTVARTLVMLAEHEDVTGLLHIPGEFQSRTVLIRRLNQRFDLGVIVEETDKRGHDRRLGSFKWKQQYNLRDLPPFEKQLEEL